MRGTSPDQLAALTLAVLDEDIAAGIFHAAILELAVHENPVIQNDVLTLKGLVFIPIHKFARKVPPRACYERAHRPRRGLEMPSTKFALRLPFMLRGCKPRSSASLARFAGNRAIPLIAPAVSAGSLSVCGFQDYSAPPLADFWSCAVRGPAIAGRRSDSTPDFSRTRAAE